MAACVHAPAALRVSPFQVLRRKIGKHTGTFYGHLNITVSRPRITKRTTPTDSSKRTVVLRVIILMYVYLYSVF